MLNSSSTPKWGATWSVSLKTSSLSPLKVAAILARSLVNFLQTAPGDDAAADKDNHDGDEAKARQKRQQRARAKGFNQQKMFAESIMLSLLMQCGGMSWLPTENSLNFSVQYGKSEQRWNGEKKCSLVCQIQANKMRRKTRALTGFSCSWLFEC